MKKKRLLLLVVAVSTFLFVGAISYALESSDVNISLQNMTANVVKNVNAKILGFAKKDVLADKKIEWKNANTACVMRKVCNPTDSEVQFNGKLLTKIEKKILAKDKVSCEWVEKCFTREYVLDKIEIEESEEILGFKDSTKETMKGVRIDLSDKRWRAK